MNHETQGAPGVGPSRTQAGALGKINQAIDTLMAMAMNSRDKDGLVYLLRSVRASLQAGLPAPQPKAEGYKPAAAIRESIDQVDGAGKPFDPRLLALIEEQLSDEFMQLELCREDEIEICMKIAWQAALAPTPPGVQQGEAT